MSTFAEYMTEEMAARGWSQRALASRIPYDHAEINRWINGVRAPSLEACAWIAAAFSGERPIALDDMDDALPVARASEAPVAYASALLEITTRVLATYGVRPKRAKMDEDGAE